MVVSFKISFWFGLLRFDLAWFGIPENAFRARPLLAFLAEVAAADVRWSPFLT